MMVKPFGDPSRSNIMVIGHDPRLRMSKTITEYSLFADYFFKPKPKQKPELDKYNLASKVYSVVQFLSDGLCSPDQVLVTNLCNEVLPHAPPGKTVLIPEDYARRGISAILNLLEGSNVRIVLPMSQQVNYWLQHLGFYPANTNFMRDATPVAKGMRNDPPYYIERRPRAFKLICGQKYTGPNMTTVFPILHVKSWPLRGHFKTTYESCYDQCRLLIIDEIKHTQILP